MPLPKMIIKVVLKDQPDDEIEVVALNPDMIRFETEQQKRGLRDSEAAPMTWMTFLAWSALTRERRYSKDWQEFKLTDCLQMIPPEEEGPTVDPTQTEDEFDSASG